MSGKKEILLNRMEIVRLKNQNIAEKNKRQEDKKQCRDLVIKYRETLKQKDLQIQKLQKQLKEIQEKNEKETQDIVQNKTNIIKRIWLKIVEDK